MAKKLSLHLPTLSDQDTHDFNLERTYEMKTLLLQRVKESLFIYLFIDL